MKTLTKKSKIWIIVSCLFFAVVAGLTTMLVLLLNKDINYDGLYIPLSQVNNLGYAQTDNSSFLIACSEKPEEVQRGMSFSTSNKTDKNDYEKVKFKDKNGDKEVNQTLHLIGFNQTQRYVFLDFSEYYSNNIYDSGFYGDHKYIVDKQSGEIYSIDVSVLENFYIIGASIRHGDMGNSILISSTHFDQTNQTTIETFYIIGIENGQLKIEEVFNSDAFKNNTTSRIIMADRYHNYIFENIDMYGNKTYFILDNNKKVSEIDLLIVNYDFYSPFYKTPVGEIITSTQMEMYILNENGIFVQTENINLINYRYENLIYADKTANTEYYFESSHTVKITYLENNDYEIEKIDYNINSSHFNKATVTNQFVFMFSTDSILKINALDGSKEVFNITYENEPVYLYNIEIYDMDRIKFYAKDSYLNEISGVVDSNGITDYTFVEKEYKIMYVPPIRK